MMVLTIGAQLQGFPQTNPDRRTLLWGAGATVGETTVGVGGSGVAVDSNVGCKVAGNVTVSVGSPTAAACVIVMVGALSTTAAAVGCAVGVGALVGTTGRNVAVATGRSRALGVKVSISYTPATSKRVTATRRAIPICWRRWGWYAFVTVGVGWSMLAAVN